MGLTSVQAMAIASRAVPAALGRAITPAELWALLAVAHYESGYGNWGAPSHAPDLQGSHNWGAIQCRTHSSLMEYLGIPDLSMANKARAIELMRARGVPSAVAGHCAMAVDFSPTKGYYVHPYRIYPDDDAGCADMARNLDSKGALEAAREAGDTYSVAAAMYAGGYYQTTHAEAGPAVRSYAEGLAEAVRKIEERTGLKSSLRPTTTAAEGGGGGGAAPFLAAGDRRAVRARLAAELARRAFALRPYLRGQDVIGLQQDLNARGASLRVDGALGPLTLAAWLCDEPPTEDHAP